MESMLAERCEWFDDGGIDSSLDEGRGNTDVDIIIIKVVVAVASMFCVELMSSVPHSCVGVDVVDTMGRVSGFVGVALSAKLIVWPSEPWVFCDGKEIVPEILSVAKYAVGSTTV